MAAFTSLWITSFPVSIDVLSNSECQKSPASGVGLHGTRIDTLVVLQKFLVFSCLDSRFSHVARRYAFEHFEDYFDSIPFRFGGMNARVDG